MAHADRKLPRNERAPDRSGEARFGLRRIAWKFSEEEFGGSLMGKRISLAVELPRSERAATGREGLGYGTRRGARGGRREV
jgi:hypothetical protein